jgi:hypothetical protein
LNLLGSGRLAGLRVLVLMAMMYVRIGRRMIVLVMDAVHVAVRSPH